MTLTQLTAFDELRGSGTILLDREGQTNVDLSGVSDINDGLAFRFDGNGAANTIVLPTIGTVSNFNDHVINGLGGDDVITTNNININSNIDGGIGHDTITTFNGTDDVSGGNGNDVINTGAGVDVIDGGDGDDTINSGSGNDVISDGDGSDSITTGSGSDIVRFTGDIENIIGKKTFDEIHGGATIDAELLGAAIFMEGDSSANFRFETNGSEQADGTGNHLFAQRFGVNDVVKATAFNDILISDDAFGAHYYGLGGDDLLSGSTILNAGNGTSDQLYGGAGEERNSGSGWAE